MVTPEEKQKIVAKLLIVRLFLADALAKQLLDSAQLYLLFFLLENVETQEDLVERLTSLEEDLPFLKELISKLQNDRQDYEDKLVAIVSKLAVSNPVLAVEVSKTALAKNMTWENLIKIYPEINN